MKLSHAIRVGEKRLAAPDQPSTAEDAIALTVLVRFAKRVHAARDSVRAVHRALVGDDELNQESLFEKKS